MVHYYARCFDPRAHVFHYEQDGAEAAGNAARVVYGDGIKILMCAYHEGPKWFETHLDLVPENDAHRSQIYLDFKNYVHCPLASVIQGAHLFDLMMGKWTALGYGTLAIKFSGAWRLAKCTYVEANDGSDTAGGAVTTNNNTESHNAKLKLAAQRRILRVYLFLTWLTTHFGNEESVQDSSFGSSLNKAVQSLKFYIRVQTIVIDPVSSNTVRFKWGDKGAYLFPATATLNEARSKLRARGVAITAASVRAFMSLPSVYNSTEPACEGSDDDSDEARVRQPLPPCGASSWLQFYIAFREDPRTFSTVDFDAAVLWAAAFYSLNPITDPQYLRRLYVRLQSTSMILMPLSGVIALGNCGLMACGCPSFLQRAWCKHSCADAICKKNIISYPKTTDPTSLGKDTTKKKKSTKGAARCFQP